MTASYAVVVVAAGGSKRLGQPKQLLLRDGETLVHRVARLAAGTNPRELLIVVGANVDVVSEALSGVLHTPVRNDQWQSGLSSSLRSATKHLPRDVVSVLVIACDQPALEAHHLEVLLDGARQASSGCAATLHGGVLGVPAVVPRAWFDELGGADRDSGFGHRLRQFPPGAVFGLEAPELSLDIDTQADLEQARAKGWVDPPVPVAD